MASPNFDSLVQRLSVLLRDYVASASSDGATYTKVRREELVNHAQRILWDIEYSGWAIPARGDSNLADSRFTDFIDVSTFTATSDTSTYTFTGLQGTVVEILSLVRAADKENVKVLNKKEYVRVLQSTVDNQAKKTNPVAYFDVNTQVLYVKPDDTNNRSKSFTAAILRFPNTILTVGGTYDIEWNPSFHQGLLNIAYAKALYDDGNIEGYISTLQSQLQLYGYNQNLLNDPNLKKSIK